MPIVGHHRIPRSVGGADEGINIMRADQKPERAMHLHHGNRVFHEKILQTLDDWDGPILVPQMRQALVSLIDTFGMDMYRPDAFKNPHIVEGMFTKRNQVYVPHHYRD